MSRWRKGKINSNGDQQEETVLNTYYAWLPSVEKVLQQLRGEQPALPRPLLVDVVRDVLNDFRLQLRNGRCPYGDQAALQAAVLSQIRRGVAAQNGPSLQRVLNATGVALHTNLGRAPLSAAAREALGNAAGYCNVEQDLESGARGDRMTHVAGLLGRLSGAEAALVVNNNAAAVFLALDTLGAGGEVIISRGELVEIGGSFRLADILAKSGCRLVEVGSTNRTRLSDYEQAISERTKLILRVHQSNFVMQGFVEQPDLAALVSLAHQYRLPLVDDLGSGCLYPLAAAGVGQEPTVAQEVAAGVDVLTFSGDKLLGGPQAGIIVGRQSYVEPLRQNQLARAFRVDKLCLAALEATLAAYVDETRAAVEIPLLRMLLRPEAELAAAAQELAALLALPGVTAQVQTGFSPVGGGALPGVELPTWLVAVTAEGWSAEKLAAHLRLAQPPVLAYIREGRVMLDVRTLTAAELPLVAQAVAQVVEDPS